MEKLQEMALKSALKNPNAKKVMAEIERMANDISEIKAILRKIEGKLK